MDLLWRKRATDTVNYVAEEVVDPLPGKLKNSVVMDSTVYSVGDSFFTVFICICGRV